MPDINAYSELLGYDVTFDFMLDDAAGQPAVYLEKIQSFKALDINHIIGSQWSSQLMAAMSYINDNNMITSNGGSTSPLVAITDNIFRLTPTDYQVGITLPEILSNWGIKAIVVIQAGDAFGDGLWNLLEQELPKKEISVIERVRYAPGVKEFSSYLDVMDNAVLDAIEEYGVEHVAVQDLGMSDDGLVFLSQTVDYPNLEKVIWFSVHGGRRQRYVDALGSSIVPKRMFSMFMTPSKTSKWENFETRYFDSISLTADFFKAAEYDATLIMALSILETQSLDASDTVKIYPEIAANYFGVTGWCELDEYGDRKPGIYDIWGYADIDGEPGFTAYGQFNAKDRSLVWDLKVLEEQGLSLPD
jgi:branched-chain amino acid transport system substrate-binding protein